MAGLLTTLSIAAKILPIIFELVKVAEAQISEAGVGASKKDLVLGIIEAANRELGEDLGISSEKLTSIASRLIDLVVGLLNKVGIFSSISRPSN